ncbi:MAG TPA: MFS transporter [Ktedonobacteraceae bacterium]|nr:MFS transporter [Ktedonobacteraceae bacterium]
MNEQDVMQEYKSRWWAFAALSLCLLVISLDNTILNVALPTLARDLSATASQQQWMVDAYILVFASLLLTMGSLSDRFGRKRALLVGLLVFCVGSIGAAFSGSANQLIAARCLMGIGGALIMPSTLSITTNMFSGKERARAIGGWSGIGALGLVIGPLTGGWLLAHFSWGWVFLINVPLIVLTILGSLWLVPESKDPAASRLDPVGALLSIGGLTTLVYAIIQVPANGWGDPVVLTCFVIAGVLLSMMILWELRSRSPMLDMKLFRNPRFSAASLALTLTAFGMFGSLFFLTQYLQEVLGYSALDAGVRTIPLALAVFVGAPLSIRITELIGTKITVTAGLMITSGGFALWSTTSPASGYGLMVVVLIVLGVGMGVAMAPATSSIMGTLPLGKAGVGSAVNDTTRMVGGTLGVAVLGSILAATYHSAIDNANTLRLLPEPLKAVVRDSISAATLVVAHVPRSIGQTIHTAAIAAFVSAMDQSLLISAGVIFCAALVALLFLPAHEKKASTDLTSLEGIATIKEREEQKEAQTKV